jgi:hypothetical protein
VFPAFMEDKVMAQWPANNALFVLIFTLGL